MEASKAFEKLTQNNVDRIASIEATANLHRSIGEKAADAITRTIGSWRFILLQSTLLVIWMAVNIIGWTRHWDPYPFIFLNLVLSFQSAYAGPIIMMSQNREARQDERRDQLDLQVNLLAEQENTEILRLLRKLCEKFEVPIDGDPEAQLLEQETRPSVLIEQIEMAINKSSVVPD